MSFAFRSRSDVQTRVISCDVESADSTFVAAATVAAVVAVCLLPPFGDFLPMLLTYESFLRTCAILATADFEVVGGSAGTLKSETAVAFSDLIGAAAATDVPQFGEAGKLKPAVVVVAVVVCEGGL